MNKRWIVGGILALAMGWNPVNAEVASADWGGGALMGYSYGQNGSGWPDTWKDPLANQNRGGFFIRDLRLDGKVAFDSTFSGFLSANVLFADMREVYLVKTWKSYTFTAGKFRGAGLYSGTTLDEYDQVTVYRPFYAQLWQNSKRIHNFRDFGIQVERSSRSGDLNYRLFFHNANWQNVIIYQPSYEVGPSTQALGLDFGLDWTVSTQNSFGGHIGALGNKEWQEFFGSHGWWNAAYWLKANPLVDASFYHLFDHGRVQVLSEAMAMTNRNEPVGPNKIDRITWGLSSRFSYTHHEHFNSFFRYEFTDPTNGANPDDGLHFFALGTRFRPAPVSHAGLSAVLEYAHIREEGLANLQHTDTFILELRHTF